MHTHNTKDKAQIRIRHGPNDPWCSTFSLKTSPKMRHSGIRAPLTVDESDSECSTSSIKRRNSAVSSYYSGSEPESDGFVSGEDENEIVSNKDEELLQETHILEEYEFSKPSAIERNRNITQERSNGNKHLFRQPSVKSLDRTISIGSSSTTGSEFVRLRIRVPNERVGREMSDGSDSDGSRLLFSESEAEPLEEEDYVMKNCNRRPLAPVADEEVSENEWKSVGRIRIPVSQKLQVPIAQISYDTDGDSQSSGDLEDDGVSFFVGVPSHEVLHTLNGAPRVRTWETDEENGCESPTENMVNSALDVDRVSNDVPSGLRSIVLASDVCESCEEYLDLDKRRDPNDGFTGKISSAHSAGEVKSLYGTVEQAEPEITELSSSICFKSASVNGDDIQTCNTVLEDDLLFNEDIASEKLATASEQVSDQTSRAVNDDDIQSSHANLEDNLFFNEDIESEKLETASEHASDQASRAENDDNVQSCNGGLEDNLIFNEDIDSEKLEAASEQVSDQTSRAVSDNHIQFQSTDTGLEENLFFNEDIESEKLETASEHAADQTSRAVNDGDIQICEGDNAIFTKGIDSEKLESASERASDQTGDIKKVHAECFLDAPSDSEQIPMSDSRLKDSSLTGKSDASQSTFRCTALDQETKKETENSEPPTAAKKFTLRTVTTAMIAENEREQDSALLSSGDILLDKSKKMEQIVTDSNAGAGPDCEMDACIEISDSPAPSSVLGSVSVHEVKDFPLEGSFSDPGSIVRSTRGIDETRSATLLGDGKSAQALSEEEKKKLEKIRKICTKYSSLLKALAHFPQNYVASTLLYQLNIGEESFFSEASHPGSDRKAGEFSLCILIIGKTGVGKSATINSIFGESKTTIDPFEPATDHVTEITGVIDGVELKIFDTPGLRNSVLDQSFNQKLLSSIRKAIRKYTPDVILYVDRLDMQTGYLNDLPLLKLVTSCLGSDIWQKTVVALTHATSELPDGPDGYPLGHEAFVAERSWVLQQLINLSSGNLLAKNPGLVVPVCLIENDQFAIMNACREAQLKNAERWRSHLLLLCGSIKILSELNSLLGIENSINKTLIDLQVDSPLLSHLSTMLQSNIHLEHRNSLDGELFNSDTEMVCSSHSDQREDDNLPEIKPLMKSECGAIWDLSVMRFRGELRYGCYIQPPIGKNIHLSICAALNDNLRGHISLKTHHSDLLQLAAALALLSISTAVLKKKRRRSQ